MKERPILFSGPMVKAILEGRKTQTRRVVRAPTEDLHHPAVHHWQMDQEHRAVAVAHSEKVADQYITTFPHYRIRCPYGIPGDRLWVRETWAPTPKYVSQTPHIAYRADYKLPISDYPPGNGLQDGAKNWSPSIFMPRWASRITLEVTDVRVQRLQDITPSDVRAEGIVDCRRALSSSNGVSPHLETQFAKLWDTINAERAPWASNPWVWVVTFKVLQ